MSRITKEQSREIAKAMVIAKEKKVQELKEYLKWLVTQAYRGSLDKDILAAWDKEKFKPFMQYTCSVNLIGTGLNHNYVEIAKTPAVNGNRATIEVDGDTAEAIVKALRDYESEKEAVKELQSQLEIVIYKLASRKNIEKHLPEALEHLPADSSNTALSIDLSNLRSKLK